MMAGSSKKATKTYLGMIQSMQISGWPPKMIKANNPTISIIKEEAQRLYHPHDNTFIISLSIVDFSTQRALVDNESSANILYYPTFQ